MADTSSSSATSGGCSFPSEPPRAHLSNGSRNPRYLGLSSMGIVPVGRLCASRHAQPRHEPSSPCAAHRLQGSASSICPSRLPAWLCFDVSTRPVTGCERPGGQTHVCFGPSGPRGSSPCALGEPRPGGRRGAPASPGAGSSASTP